MDRHEPVPFIIFFKNNDSSLFASRQIYCLVVQ